MIEHFWTMMQRSTGRRSHSSAVGQNIFRIMILSAALIYAHNQNMSEIFLYVLAGALMLEVLHDIVLQWFFAIWKPEFLRSEMHSLAMQALQKRGMRGDDLIGFMKTITSDDVPDSPNSLPPPTQPRQDAIDGAGTGASVEP